MKAIIEMDDFEKLGLTALVICVTLIALINKAHENRLNVNALL